MLHQRIIAALVCLSATAGIACTQVVAESSPCRNLVYQDGEVPRAEYLPCAGEIVTALDELDRHTKAALDGDRQARSDGKTTLRRVTALMKAAGGRQLLERWKDRPLMNLNVNIHNAVTHYDAFYMLRILDDPDPFAAKSRQAARSEFDNAHRRYGEASRLFRSLN